MGVGGGGPRGAQRLTLEAHIPDTGNIMVDANCAIAIKQAVDTRRGHARTQELHRADLIKRERGKETRLPSGLLR